LAKILAKLADTKEQENVEEGALARVRGAQAERASDGAWGATLCRVTLNGKHLADTESNRAMLESPLWLFVSGQSLLRALCQVGHALVG